MTNIYFEKWNLRQLLKLLTKLPKLSSYPDFAIVYILKPDGCQHIDNTTFIIRYIPVKKIFTFLKGT